MVGVGPTGVAVTSSARALIRLAAACKLACAVTVSLLLSSPAFAAVTTGHSDSFAALDTVTRAFTAEGRIGGAPWELRLGLVVSPAETRDFTWVPGAVNNWTLTYTPTVQGGSITGAIQFGFGGELLEIQAPISVFDAIFITTRADRAGTGIVVDDLEGATIIDDLSMADGDGQRRDVLKISGAVGSLTPFTLTGTVVMNFDPEVPTPPKLSFEIIAGKGLAGDTDGDGIKDVDDNCPSIGNATQADTDGDGRGNACDNCPATSNPSQKDGDGDCRLPNGQRTGLPCGDACDNCGPLTLPLGENIAINFDQADSDGDQVGDACDNCIADPNPDQADGTPGTPKGDACEGQLVTAFSGGGAPLAGPFFVATTTTLAGVTTFDLELVCGAANVAVANLGFATSGATAAQYADCTTADPDPGADPTRRLCNGSAELGSGTGAPTVDPNTSFSLGIGIADPDTSDAFDVPADLFLASVHGNIVDSGFIAPLLCRANDPPVALGTLSLTDLPVDATISIVTDGFAAFSPPLEQLVDGNNTSLVDVDTATGPANPLLVLEVKPALDDVSGFRRWQVTAQSDILIHRLTVGLEGPSGILPSQMQFGSCTIPVAGAANVLRVCEPRNADLGPGVDDFVSSVPPDPVLDGDSFTLGPNAPLSGTLPKAGVLYASMLGNFFASGLPRSINHPGVRGLLGVVTYTVDPSAPAPPRPKITFEGADLLGVGQAIQSSTGDPADQISPADVLRVGGGDAGSDTDQDGIGDEDDNCVHVANSGQEDEGSIASSAADGIGNTCQCGDSSGDGPVADAIPEVSDEDDVETCLELLAGLPPDPSDPGASARCSVTGGTEFDIVDVVTLQAELENSPLPSGATIDQVCQQAVQQAP